MPLTKLLSSDARNTTAFAANVRVEGPVEMFFGNLAQGREATASGICEENIESPFFALDRIEETVEICEVGDISGKRRRIGAEFFRRGIQLALAPASSPSK
jgi:hypothetical protein